MFNGIILSARSHVSDDSLTSWDSSRWTVVGCVYIAVPCSTEASERGWARPRQTPTRLDVVESVVSSAASKRCWSLVWSLSYTTSVTGWFGTLLLHTHSPVSGPTAMVSLIKIQVTCLPYWILELWLETWQSAESLSRLHPVFTSDWHLLDGTTLLLPSPINESVVSRSTFQSTA